MCIIRPIRNENDYIAALQILTSLWSKAEQSSYEVDQLEVWGALIDYHEQMLYPFEFPDSIEALKFHIDQQEMNLKDLCEIFGSTENVKAVLERRNQLTLKEVEKLCKNWKIPAESLIKPYELNF